MAMIILHQHTPEEMEALIERAATKGAQKAIEEMNLPELATKDDLQLVKEDLQSLRTEVKSDMTAMEERLNQKIEKEVRQAIPQIRDQILNSPVFDQKIDDKVRQRFQEAASV